MIRTVLGIDPGAGETGLCVRRGREVLAATVVTNQSAYCKGVVAVTPTYCCAVATVVDALISEHDVDLVGLEGVKPPNPHVNRRNGNAVIDPAPLLGTAIVLGHLTCFTADRLPVVWVAPGKNGSMPLLAYPAELVTDGERRHGLNRIGGSSPLRHARSAYDVAGAAPLTWRASPQAR